MVKEKKVSVSECGNSIPYCRPEKLRGIPRFPPRDWLSAQRCPRRVYLVGCDFRMARDWKYWFEEDPTDASIKNNRKSYRRLTEYFTALLPRLQAAGLEVWNCNPESALRVFPFADLESAVRQAETDTSGETRGMYEAMRTR